MARGRPFQTHCDKGHLLPKKLRPKGHNKRRRCKLCQKDYKLRSIGWNTELYENTLTEQGNKCAICERPLHFGFPKTARQANADHNHETMEPRGVLCHSCNVLIGYAEEDLIVLEKALVYLKKWSK